MARYKHDCSDCVYLGKYRDCDLYFCAHGGSIPTVVARYGNKGYDYISGLDSELAPLVEAKRRAEIRGLWARRGRNEQKFQGVG